MQNQLTAPAEIQNNNQIVKIDGKYGTITVFKSVRETTKADMDLHSLLASILIKKEKRLALGE